MRMNWPIVRERHKPGSPESPIVSDKGAVMRSFAVFAVAGALALLAANHRFGDSAHAIGLINRNGGKAVHPFMLDSDHDTYTVIATATVQPSYRGDARVIVEGLPPTSYNFV